MIMRLRSNSAAHFLRTIKEAEQNRSCSLGKTIPVQPVAGKTGEAIVSVTLGIKCSLNEL